MFGILCEVVNLTQVGIQVYESSGAVLFGLGGEENHGSGDTRVILSHFAEGVFEGVTLTDILLVCIIRSSILVVILHLVGTVVLQFVGLGGVVQFTCAVRIAITVGHSRVVIVGILRPVDTREYGLTGICRIGDFRTALKPVRWAGERRRIFGVGAIPPLQIGILEDVALLVDSRHTPGNGLDVVHGIGTTFHIITQVVHLDETRTIHDAGKVGDFQTGSHALHIHLNGVIFRGLFRFLDGTFGNVGPVFDFILSVFILTLHRGSEHNEIGLATGLVPEINLRLGGCISDRLDLDAGKGFGAAGLESGQHRFQRLVAIEIRVAGVDDAKHLVGHGHGGLHYYNTTLLGGAIVKIFFNFTVVNSGTGGVFGGKFLTDFAIAPRDVSAVLVEEEIDGVDPVLEIFTF